MMERTVFSTMARMSPPLPGCGWTVSHFALTGNMAGILPTPYSTYWACEARHVNAVQVQAAVGLALQCERSPLFRWGGPENVRHVSDVADSAGSQRHVHVARMNLDAVLN